jgi:predicted AlkP superfamily phosphohydrolase/phosphomutase
MIKPDYKGGSIVNLMSSIAGAFGTKSDYKQLRILKANELKKSRNIVVILIDGLGYEYLKRKGKNTFLEKNLRGSMTSVFPATTAAAVTSFATGTAPQQHTYSGWYVYLKEIGTVMRIMPFQPRAGGRTLDNYGLKTEDFLGTKSFTERIKAKSYVVMYKELVKTDYTRALFKKAKISGYNSPGGMFKQIRKAINSSNRRKYIYVYWPMFDKMNHKYGVNSRKTERQFKIINKRIESFVKKIKNTTIIITADHGFMEHTKKEVIQLEKHPKMQECLALPLCGEARLVYCYVKPGKTKQFEKYVKTKLRKYCDLYKSEELIKKNYFGLYKANPKLKDRIGDYVIVMKKNYALKDWLLNQKRSFSKGKHAGVSKEEMIVPLIVISK